MNISLGCVLAMEQLYLLLADAVENNDDLAIAHL